MTRLLPQAFSPLRPNDADLSTETQFQIQLHRLLTLLGAVLVPAFGLLYSIYNPLEVGPDWVRLVIATLFVTLFVSSYWVETIRRHYVAWMRSLLYLLLGWTILVTTLNHFAGDYVAGLLLVYAALIVVVGVGTQTLQPVLRFSVAGIAATTVASFFEIAPYTNPAVLIASMATIAVIEGIAIRAYLSTRAELREREQRLRGLANSVPGVLYQFAARDDGYTNTFVGDYAETLMGISSTPDDFYDRIVEHIPEPEREHFVGSIDRAVENEDSWHREFPFDRPDGERLWLYGTSTPENHGNTLIFNGVILDITSRKRAEQRLEDREQKAEALYTATEGLLTASTTDEVAGRLEEIIWSTFDYAVNSVHFARNSTLVPVAVSPHVSEQMPDVPPTRVDGHSLSAEAYRANTTIVMDDLREVNNDLEYGKLRAGACIPVGRHGVISLASTDVDGIDPFDVQLVEILAAHAVAVLDRIDREEALVEAKEQAEDANRLKTALLANMSHELRTPLTSVTGFSELLKERLDGEPAKLCTRIHRSGRRLMRTLNGVLELSQLEAGEFDLTPEKVDLTRIARETTRTHRKSAKQKSIQLETNLEREVIGLWNEQALRSIIDNLLDNAIKFTSAGGTVEINVGVTDTNAVLEVADTGIGISQESLPDVFTAFKQESEGLDREYEGSGIGLSIVAELTDTMGGDVDIESEKGEGTRVVVRLPRHHEKETANEERRLQTVE